MRVLTFLLPVATAFTAARLSPRFARIKLGRSVGTGPIREEWVGKGGTLPSNPTILQNITASRYANVEEAKARVSVEELQAAITAFDAAHGGPLSLRARLQSEKMAIAAEFKRASPSKGVMAEGADAADQGRTYASVGASVISVLTEPLWFKGSLDDMKSVREATNLELTSSPTPEKTSAWQRPAILRKDFIVDQYQLLEARANGADTILLIVAILEETQLSELITASRALGMEPLVEVHTEEELDIALDCGADVIGVNNRNLHTFQLDTETTARLLIYLRAKRAAEGLDGPEPLMMALSGISDPVQVAQCADIGICGVLVGEALMRASDPAQAIKDLLSGGKGDRLLVKVCGVTDAETATLACRQGASLVGIILAPKSPRKVETAAARQIVAAVRSFGERDGVKRPVMSSEQQQLPSPGTSWYEHAALALRKATQRTPLVVGVFQNQGAEEVIRLAEETGVDLVQFHGSESDEEIAKVGLPAIRVLHVPPYSEGNDADDDATAGSENESQTKARVQELLSRVTDPPRDVVALLLDTAVTGQQGGTGKTCDWGLAAALTSPPYSLPVLLAGGLQDENVAKAVSLVTSQDDGPSSLLGVDASSGLEFPGSPGTKDPARVTVFLREAFSAAQHQQQQQ